jgi:hypothetical protein
MAGRKAVPRGEIVVDDRGRTTLARVRKHTFTRYLAQELEDGTIVLTPAITLTPDEVEKLRAERGWIPEGARVLRLPGDALREPSAAERRREP